MEALTEISSITFDPIGRGHVFVEFAKILRFGTVIVNRTIHRHMLAPGSDIAAELVAVNAALVESGFPPVSQQDVAMIQSVADVQWTDERIQAWQDELAAMA